VRKNTNQTILFKEISERKAEVDFSGSEVSSDARLLFLREKESPICIINQIPDAIHDKRHPSYAKYQILQLLTQRVFQITSGYEDGNDSNDLKSDPILKNSCEKDDPLASQPTMCRFENAPTRTALYRIANVFVDAFINSYDSPPQSLVSLYLYALHYSAPEFYDYCNRYNIKYVFVCDNYQQNTN
jgi:hypothetical protein